MTTRGALGVRYHTEFPPEPPAVSQSGFTLLSNGKQNRGWTAEDAPERDDANTPGPPSTLPPQLRHPVPTASLKFSYLGNFKQLKFTSASSQVNRFMQAHLVFRSGLPKAKTRRVSGLGAAGSSGEMGF